jgi:hypothetical protein
MITLDRSTDQKTFLIPQEEHADLAAQFASHWGNEKFSRLVPFDTMVFAAVYHDSQYREVEADLPIDLEQGRPHGHRTTPSSAKKLDALRQNIEWVESRDPYAGLMVSMHHSGLAQNRYGVIKSWQNTLGTTIPKKPMRPDMEVMVREMEARQRARVEEFGKRDPATEKQVRTNYRLFQVFDLLSLYFCCDGHGDKGMKDVTIGPIPMSYKNGDETDLHLIPLSDGVIRIDPYPFDQSPLRVSVFGRTVRRLAGRAEADCRAEYYSAPREILTWTLTK